MMENGMITRLSAKLLYPVDNGSYIELLDEAYEYRYAFYSCRQPLEYIYTYAYQEE